MEQLYNSDGITIFSATTAEDYTRMFDVRCGSCMVMPPANAFSFFGQKKWRDVLDLYQLHPAAWYHYTGYSQGVWMEYEGRPLARGMRYRPLAGYNADGTPHYDDWVAFGDVKYETAQCGHVLSELVRSELHIPRLPPNTMVTTLNSFSIPALELDGDYVCPLAHSDNNEKDFAVAFMEKGLDGTGDPIFRFTPLSQHPDRSKFLHVRSTYDWDGYVSAEVLARALKEDHERHANSFVPGLNRLVKGKSNGRYQKRTATKAAS